MCSIGETDNTKSVHIILLINVVLNLLNSKTILETCIYCIYMCVETIDKMILETDEAKVIMGYVILHL